VSHAFHSKGLCTYPLFPLQSMLFHMQVQGPLVLVHLRRGNLPFHAHGREEKMEDDTPRTTKRQRAMAAKKTTSRPVKSMKDINLRQFLDIRNVNPYVVEKNTRLCPNPYFYSKNQERIFNEIYKVKTSLVAPNGQPTWRRWTTTSTTLEKPRLFVRSLELCR
jgi:hypothetical protein